MNHIIIMSTNSEWRCVLKSADRKCFTWNKSVKRDKKQVSFLTERQVVSLQLPTQIRKLLYNLYLLEKGALKIEWKQQRNHGWLHTRVQLLLSENYCRKYSSLKETWILLKYIRCTFDLWSLSLFKTVFGNISSHNPLYKKPGVISYLRSWEDTRTTVKHFLLRDLNKPKWRNKSSSRKRLLKVMTRKSDS